MEQARTSSSAPAAVLAGSLAAFPLPDVLELLARTRHSGELQVVSNGVDERLRLDDGDLLDPAGNAAGRLFDLACLRDAWFSVTMAAAGTRSANGVRTNLRSLIDQLAPDVAEWRSLVASLPPDAAVRLAPSTPAPEVQIRAEQWQVLSTVGAGRVVREVLEAAGHRPLETLRILKQLIDCSLLSITPPSRADAPAAPVAPTPSEAPGALPAPAMPSVPGPSDQLVVDRAGTDEARAPRPADAPSPPAFMPPPVTGDLLSLLAAPGNADRTASLDRLPA